MWKVIEGFLGNQAAQLMGGPAGDAVLAADGIHLTQVFCRQDGTGFALTISTNDDPTTIEFSAPCPHHPRSRAHARGRKAAIIF